MTVGYAQRRVLLAEHNLTEEQALLTAINDHQPDWRITVARSAAQVHDAMASNSLDIALIDSNLPGGITDLVRALTGTGTAIVVLVAAGGEGAAARALQAGTIEFVSKDTGRLYLTTLSWRVELALQRAAASRTADELRLHAVLDASDVPTALNDDQQRITFVNAAFIRTYGYERSDIPTLADWWPVAYPDPAYRAWVVAEWKLRLDHSLRPGGVFEPMELAVRCRDGRWVTVLASVAPLTAAALGLHMVLLYDITAKKKAEADLHAASVWQHALVTQAGDAIISADPDGIILTFNPAAERMLGYSAHEIIGQSQTVFHDANEIEQRARLFSRELGEAIQPGYGVLVAKAIRRLPNRHDWTCIHKDGARFQVSLSVTALTGLSGAIEGFVGVASDITTRLQAEAALRASEARYRTIIEAEPECVKIVSAVGEVLEMNGAGLAMLEADSLTAVRERGFTTFVVPEHRAAFGALHKQAIAGVRGLLEFEVVGLRGTRRWVETHAAPLPDADGRVDKILAVTRDVTARRQAAAEQAMLTAQLAQAQKLESIGRLAGGVAHDFNNMLGVILGHSELAIDSTSPESSAYNDLQQIRSAAQRSAGLTRQLLAFARKQPIEPQRLDVNAAVSALFTMVNRLIGENVVVEWTPAPAVWPVWMDVSQFDQIVTNLCVNARDAILAGSPGVGVVSITTSNVVVDDDFCLAHPSASVGEYVNVVVRDTGAGIDDAIIDRVFEPFFTTKDVGAGTGLGLATVEGAIRQNGGFVTVSSELGRGSRFAVYLPRYEGMRVSAVAVAIPDTATRTRGTILIVEDEPAILTLTCRILTRRGYVVLSASGATEAIELAGAHAGSIDLLLTDVIMPTMNGRDLAAAVSAHYPDIRVLYMSGYTNDIIAKHGVMHASLHFLQKPFSVSALQHAVSEAMSAPPPFAAVREHEPGRS